MAASPSTKLTLAFRSGNRCAFPGCPRELTVDSPSGGEPAATGEAAHIRGESAGSARYDASMTDADRNSVHNLLYLCGDHHTQVDRQVADFPVERLVAMKVEHEKKARLATDAGFAEVAFPELARATAWVQSAPAQAYPRDLTVIPPEDKIRRNELSAPSRLTITMGLSTAPVVHRFVENEAMLDPGYPDRLKSGFLAEYYRLRTDGLRGDDLFDAVCAYAQRGLHAPSDRSAAIAVLVYLFERCEVFEK